MENNTRVRYIQNRDEKNYYTLQLLESSFMLGSEVFITQVKEYSLDYKSGESFSFYPTLHTFIIFDEKPKVSLLQQFGWYRENQTSPIIAYIPTHLLFNKETNQVVNDKLIFGTRFKNILLDTDETYELRPIKITRGAIIDIVYDFINKTDNKFYVTEVFVDTISLQYIANLIPYKHELDSIAPEDDKNINKINFDSSKTIL